MNQLSDLSTRVAGELEAAICNELRPLSVGCFLPDINNNLGPSINRPYAAQLKHLPIDLELPPRRYYGRIDGPNGSAWLFRYDAGYTVVSTIQLLQRKIDALTVLSDGDLLFSTAPQDGTGVQLIKLCNYHSLALVANELHLAAFHGS